MTPLQTTALPAPPALPEYHVIVRFGAGVPSYAQGQAMLAFEKRLRELTGMDVEVFKSTMEDDSKLRRSMSPEQRAKL